MEEIPGINRNINFVMGVAQKSSTWDAVNFQKFIEDKGFRPSNDIARNASIEASDFHKKLLASLNFGMKQEMHVLSDMYNVLKEILSKMGSQNSVRSNVIVNNLKQSRSMHTIINNVFTKSSVVSNTTLIYQGQIKDKEAKESNSTDFVHKLLEKVEDVALEKIIDKLLDKLPIFKKEDDNIKLNIALKMFGNATGKKKITDLVPEKTKSKAIAKVAKVAPVEKVESKILSSGVKTGIEKLALGGVGEKVAKITQGFKTMQAQTIATTIAQWGFNSSLLANPITWVVVGIIGLIAIIILLAKNWDKVKAAVQSFCNYLQSAFANFGPWFQQTVINPLLNLMPDWLKKFFGVGNSVTVNASIKANEKNKQLACGLSYVPYDGYAAELHKGERVLTASENRAYSNPPRTYSSNTVSRGGNTFNISINGVNKSTDEIISDLLNKIAEAANTMGEVAFD